MQNVDATPDTVFLYNGEGSRNINYSLNWEVAYYSTDLKTPVNFPVVTTGGGKRMIDHITLKPNQVLPMSKAYNLTVSEGSYRFTVEVNSQLIYSKKNLI